MDQKSFFTLLFLFFSTSSFAGLETCGQTSDQTRNLNVICSKPFVNGLDRNSLVCGEQSSAIKSNLTQQLKPYLIYYAVDSKEPFMQAAVDFEVKELIKNCTEESKINWVAFLNSHFTNIQEGPFFLICENGQFSKKTYEENYLKVASKKIDLIKSSASPNEQRGIIRHFVRFPKYGTDSRGNKVDLGEAFAHHPFSHPDFLYDSMIYARKYFPSSQFIPFVHIKSHGSSEFLMTGLTSEQESNKEECQNEIMGRVDEVRQLPIPKYGEAGLGAYTTNDTILYGDSLGNRARLSTDNGGLGNRGRLGVKVGLGGVAGLGANGGLNSTNHFGMMHLKVPQLLTNLTLNSGDTSDIAFIMFESCETNIQKKRVLNDYTSQLSNVKSYYSAEGSLWYRNLNWHKLLKDSMKQEKNQSQFLQESVLKEVMQIPNYLEN